MIDHDLPFGTDVDFRSSICDPILQKGVLRKKVYFEKNDKIGTDVKVGGFQFFH